MTCELTKCHACGWSYPEGWTHPCWRLRVLGFTSMIVRWLKRLTLERSILSYIEFAGREVIHANEPKEPPHG